MAPLLVIVLALSATVVSCTAAFVTGISQARQWLVGLFLLAALVSVGVGFAAQTQLPAQQVTCDSACLVETVIGKISRLL